MLRLLDAYDGLADGNGHLVLREEAVECFHEQLTHARKGCVSDPEWGAFCPDGPTLSAARATQSSFRSGA